MRDCLKLKIELERADAVLIGAGSGLSTSAGFTYSGSRFKKYFSDFKEMYAMTDMYSGGFYPFPSIEEHWAYWSKYIWINRYMRAEKPVYEILFNLIKSKDYFVLTTNVDHAFQSSGFDKSRLFYTQGDYGLFQCSRPCHRMTYDNFDIVKEMVLSQGFTIGKNDELLFPDREKIKMTIPGNLVPLCPKCGAPMSMNLHSDGTFVEDDGWHEAAKRYLKFLKEHEKCHMLFLELGVGGNTPGIIKYPFWRMCAENHNSTYVSINKGEAFSPREISSRSICIDGDIFAILTLVGKEKDYD